MYTLQSRKYFTNEYSIIWIKCETSLAIKLHIKEGQNVFRRY